MLFKQHFPNPTENLLLLQSWSSSTSRSCVKVILIRFEVSPQSPAQLTVLESDALKKIFDSK